MENWRPVAGYEGLYEVSDEGGVRSIDSIRSDATGTKLRKRRGKILKPWISNGYASVRLSVRGATRAITVHSLVAAAFIGPRPPESHVCHWNGNKGDNRSSNLRYGTASENQLDTVRYGGNQWAKRDECKNGHPYTPENTGYYPSAPRTRKCRTCLRERARARRQKAASR